MRVMWRLRPIKLVTGPLGRDTNECVWRHVGALGKINRRESKGEQLELAHGSTPIAFALIIAIARI